MNEPLPEDPDADRALLGVMMLGPQAVRDVCQRVGPEVLYSEKHRRWFEIIRDRVVEVGGKIAPTDLADKIDDVPELMRCMESVTSLGAQYVEFYCRRVRNSSVRREVIATAQAAIEAARDSNRDLDDVARLVGLPSPGVRKSFGATSARALVTEHPELRPVVVEGLLRAGETANIVSVTKAGKSWLTLNLALAVAHGLPWLGHWTKQGKVLLVDNELHPETLASRLQTVANATGVDVPDNLVVETLRGRLATIHDVGRFLDEAATPGEFSLIVFDALYRMLPEGTSENDNAQMTAVYNEVDRIADRTRAAVATVHHATKGWAGGEADDRRGERCREHVPRRRRCVPFRRWNGGACAGDSHCSSRTARWIRGS